MIPFLTLAVPDMHLLSSPLEGTCLLPKTARVNPSSSEFLTLSAPIAGAVGRIDEFRGLSNSSLCSSFHSTRLAILLASDSPQHILPIRLAAALHLEALDRDVVLRWRLVHA
jgi:hypothetical protein